MKHVVARLDQGKPRFFVGRYRDGIAALPAPIDGPSIDDARIYEPRVVAELLVEFLNFRAGLDAGVAGLRIWSVVDLPEDRP